MLSHAPVTHVVPTVDLPRSRRFYEQQLGLSPQGEQADGSFTLSTGAGGLIALSPRAQASPSPHTRLSFEVPDLAAEIQDLESRGVKFEDYDLPDFKTTGHICQLADHSCAWFNDPDGNILCLHQRGVLPSPTARSGEPRAPA